MRGIVWIVLGGFEVFAVTACRGGLASEATPEASASASLDMLSRPRRPGRNRGPLKAAEPPASSILFTVDTAKHPCAHYTIAQMLEEAGYHVERDTTDFPIDVMVRFGRADAGRTGELRLEAERRDREHRGENIAGAYLQVRTNEEPTEENLEWLAAELVQSPQFAAYLRERKEGNADRVSGEFTWSRERARICAMADAGKVVARRESQ